MRGRAEGPAAGTAPELHLTLLGGFRVERDDVPLADSAWQQRRAAKSLVKLLAVEASHSLHREQILDILWPDFDSESALNSFGKALHVARHALEPDLLPRENSAFLRLSDDVVTLDTRHVLIDADHFEQLSERALQGSDLAAYETALAAYSGDLLPEDRYEDWASDRRTGLIEVRTRLLLGLADALEKRGAHKRAAEYLRQILQQEPTREEVHRRLMRLYAEMGSRHEAVRQYQICRDVLHRELDIDPEEETEALHQDVLGNRIPKRLSDEMTADAASPSPLPPLRYPLDKPFVGREDVLQVLHDELAEAGEGRGGMVLVSGEAGVGKTRLVAELASQAMSRGVLVLWDGGSMTRSPVPYGALAASLESYIARLGLDERDELARRYPELISLAPSLGTANLLSSPIHAPDSDDRHLFSAIARFLIDLAVARPILLVFSDLHAADPPSIHLLQFLIHLALQRPWLVVGTYRVEAVAAGSDLQQMLEMTRREWLCRHIELSPLARSDCDELVGALLPDGIPDVAVLEHVYELSRGNPRLVQELVQALQEWGDLSLSSGYWHLSPSATVRAPRSVRTLVETEMASMDESVRRVLTLAAAAGTQFTLTDLRAAGASLIPPISGSTVLDALDCGLDGGILEERSNAYAFRHPLVRAALYQNLPQHRRAQFHAALGYPASPSPSSMGYRGERIPSTQVLVPGIEEADQLFARDINSSARGAAEAYGDLVDWLDALERPLDGAYARQKLAGALTTMGRYGRALQVLRQAWDAYSLAGDQAALERITAQIEMVRRLHDGNQDVGDVSFRAAGA